MTSEKLNSAQVLDALRCGAAHTGRPAVAGLHLLLATWPDLVALHQGGALEVTEKPVRGGQMALHARVIDWFALIDAKPTGSSDQLLLKLASSYAADKLVTLGGHVQGLRPEHALAAAEAVLICAGVTPLFQVRETSSPLKFPAGPPIAFDLMEAYR